MEISNQKNTPVNIDQYANAKVMDTKRKTWKTDLVAWSDLEEKLNDLEDDGYKVMNIFEEKLPQEGQLEEYCLVIAKNTDKTKKRRFY